MSHNALFQIQDIESFKAIIRKNRKNFLVFMVCFWTPLLMFWVPLANNWDTVLSAVLLFIAGVFISLFSLHYFGDIFLESAEPLSEDKQRDFLRHLQVCSEYPEIAAFIENIQRQNRRPVNKELEILIAFSAPIYRQKERASAEENTKKLWELSIKTVSAQKEPSAG